MHKNFKPKRVVLMPGVVFDTNAQTTGALTGPDKPTALIVPKEARDAV